MVTNACYDGGRTTSVGSDWVDAQHPAVLASGCAFHPSGAVTAVDLGNGTRTVRSFVSGGLPKTLQHGTALDRGSPPSESAPQIMLRPCSNVRMSRSFARAGKRSPQALSLIVTAKGYSLTDCIAMQTMRREALTDVLTNDRHFTQEGFHALFADR